MVHGETHGETFCIDLNKEEMDLWIYGFRDLRIHDSFPEIRVCICFFLVCEWAWFWAGL